MPRCDRAPAPSRSLVAKMFLDSQFALTIAACFLSSCQRVESGVIADVYRDLPQMKSVQLKTAIQILAHYDQHREPFENIRTRRASTERQNRWLAQSHQILVRQHHPSGRDRLLCRNYLSAGSAVNRLLQVEMALRLIEWIMPVCQQSCRLVRAKSNVPTDPFDGDAGTFCYELSDIGFKLWSVGPDGKDDGGIPLPKNEYGGTSLDAEGDIRLEDYFGEDESSLDFTRFIPQRRRHIKRFGQHNRHGYGRSRPAKLTDHWAYNPADPSASSDNGEPN